MKLAYFSPLNPQPSGISDYSEELLPYLAAHAEIDLFVDGFRPSNQKLLSTLRWFDYQRNPASIEHLGEYDAIVYHVGNDHRYHSGMVQLMRRHPGVVVFHDFALQDFFLGQAREQNDINIYLEELEACHGKSERLIAEEFVRRGGTPPQAAAPLGFPLNARLARSAEGIIVHSEWSRYRLASIAPGVPISRIHHHITARAAATPFTKEESSGNGGMPLRLASFGLITRDKGIERALAALAALQTEFDFHYTLVGSKKDFPGLEQLLRDYGLEGRVTITGHVSLTDFERLISETDIAINLRERPVGATSGSLCRIMAAGVPAIVSNVGAFAELPGEAVVKIDADGYGDALLQAYLRKLMEDKSLRERIGRNARNYVVANHDIECSAASYAAFIRKVIARRPRKQFINGVADELSALGLRASNDVLLQDVAQEIARLAPATPSNARAGTGNGHLRSSQPPTETPGRLPKLEGIDYKRAALEYPRMLDAERSYYLRTKPFYNLANKPDKHLGDGMDAETHRHFTDFANMASVLALPPGARILDVGCGSGWLSEYFARLGYEVTGIDISDELIAMAQERARRVPYDVDHETKLRCRFQTQDIETAPLAERFDAVVCYDSLHHFEDEQKVFRHLAAMLDVGGLLFILEGHKPSAGSATEDELQDVMRQFGTLESPFSSDYLRQLLFANGFVVVGDYVSVNGFFEREMLEDDRLPLRSIATDYHYLTCIKVTEDSSANVPDSRKPGLLRAEFSLLEPPARSVEVGAKLQLAIAIRNAGDTLWLNGQTLRTGVVMPGVRVINKAGEIISEVHGHPMLPRAVAPGQSLAIEIPCPVPPSPGTYTVKIDLVDQQVCWFEERGSQPLVLEFEVKEKAD